ncbi:MAG: hypothetical protein RL033_4866 [Pseudomonadota bacterium]|jgi:selenophosphate synthetase-related protein
MGLYRASVIAMLLVASACGDAQRPAQVELELVPRPAEIDANTVVTLQRDSCYGGCPVYSVRMEGDGSVAFNGKQFVQTIGEATGQAPIADVSGLVGAMLDVDYFSLESDGGCRPGDTVTFISDASGATTSLTLGDRTKAIRDFHGNSCAPRVLRSIEDLIDEVAGTARWVKCPTPDGFCPPTSAELEGGG